ncbi:hypothetical protein ACLQ25_32660 [Micromonospora sp. DT44]|uniref:hypothetical protein n=1 Tax=Micromonospora sp. DT44 TaxID=3393439 RepID=UPI003CF56B73
MHEVDDYDRLARLVNALLLQTRAGRLRWRMRNALAQEIISYTTSTSSATISIGKQLSVDMLIFSVQDATGKVIEEYTDGPVLYAPQAGELNQLLRFLWQHVDKERERKGSFIDNIINELHHSPPSNNDRD